MQVLHKAEQPDTRVFAGLTKAGPHGALLFGVDLVALQTTMSELTLVLSKPSGGERSVGEEGVSADGHNASNGALNDEEPLPAGISQLTVELKDANGNQTCESSGQNVAGVEDGDAR